MGRGLYHQTMLEEAYLNRKHPHISEYYEVTNRKEYVQYLNCLDEKPSNLGGRNNTWREISFDGKDWDIH
jgi:hypothetical protein